LILDALADESSVFIDANIFVYYFTADDVKNAVEEEPFRVRFTACAQ
jgi:hypothetical protein